MLLYHGTSAAFLDEIKQKGILPRRISKGRDNWKHTVSSNKDAVYLTTAYAWHFASHASNDKKGLILEIDRDLLPDYFRLCPDEDFLEQATRKQVGPNFAPLDWSMKKRTLYYRKNAISNPLMADKSLEHMGTAAYYGTIPWSAVTRYAVVDWQKNKWAWFRASDSMVSMMNYRILQDRHKAFTRWFFNDPVTAHELSGEGEYQYDKLDDDIRKFVEQQEERMKQLEAAMADRTGIEVVDLRKQLGNHVSVKDVIAFEKADPAKAGCTC